MGVAEVLLDEVLAHHMLHRPVDEAAVQHVGRGVGTQHAVLEPLTLASASLQTNPQPPPTPCSRSAWRMLTNVRAAVRQTLPAMSAALSLPPTISTRFPSHQRRVSSVQGRASDSGPSPRASFFTRPYLGVIVCVQTFSGEPSEHSRRGGVRTAIDPRSNHQAVGTDDDTPPCRHLPRG